MQGWRQGFLSAFLVLLSFTLAQADPPEGFYLGLNAGRTRNNFYDALLGLSFVNPHHFSYGGGGFLGYQFHPNWSSEVGYLYLGRTTFQNINRTQAQGDLTISVADWVFKWMESYHNGTTLYAKFGVARAFVRPDSQIKALSTKVLNSLNDTNVYYGLGVSYNVSRHVALDGHWQHYPNNKKIADLDYFGLGLIFYFG